ncbi:MAG: hypothetical protein ACLTCP_11740 [Ruminococcus bicirculans (ex Wegman et al. 2014)]
MKICIVGLGLMTVRLQGNKKNTHESCFGIDIDRGTIAGRWLRRLSTVK